MDRELHEEKELVVYARIVFEEIVYAPVIPYHGFGVEERDASEGTLVDHIGTHHFYESWDLGDLVLKDTDYLAFPGLEWCW